MLYSCFRRHYALLSNAVSYPGGHRHNRTQHLGDNGYYRTTSWMDVARLVRAEILTLKERDFVAAARVVGASDFRIIFRHILPNALSPVFVSATLGVAGAILLESGLSFLGLGVQAAGRELGNILTSGKDYITVGAWWLSFFPGMAILFTVLSYNLVGEGFETLSIRGFGARGNK